MKTQFMFQERKAIDENGLWLLERKADNGKTVVYKKGAKLKVWDRSKGIRIFRDKISSYVWYKLIKIIVEENFMDGDGI